MVERVFAVTLALGILLTPLAVETQPAGRLAKPGGSACGESPYGARRPLSKYLVCGQRRGAPLTAFREALRSGLAVVFLLAIFSASCTARSVDALVGEYALKPEGRAEVKISRDGDQFVASDAKAAAGHVPRALSCVPKPITLSFSALDGNRLNRSGFARRTAPSASSESRRAQLPRDVPSRPGISCSPSAGATSTSYEIGAGRGLPRGKMAGKRRRDREGTGVPARGQGGDRHGRQRRHPPWHGAGPRAGRGAHRDRSARRGQGQGRGEGARCLRHRGPRRHHGRH